MNEETSFNNFLSIIILLIISPAFILYFAIMIVQYRTEQYILREINCTINELKNTYAKGIPGSPELILRSEYWKERLHFQILSNRFNGSLQDIELYCHENKINPLVVLNNENHKNKLKDYLFEVKKIREESDLIRRKWAIELNEK